MYIDCTLNILSRANTFLFYIQFKRTHKCSVILLNFNRFALMHCCTSEAYFFYISEACCCHMPMNALALCYGDYQWIQRCSVDEDSILIFFFAKVKRYMLIEDKHELFLRKKNVKLAQKVMRQEVFLFFYSIQRQSRLKRSQSQE